MKSEHKIIIAMSVLFIVESALLFFAWRNSKNKPSPEVIYKERVITRVDTFEVLKPVEIVKERKVTDTMFIPVADTIRFRDTLLVPVEREQRVYRDSAYRAVVSGYQPRLDAIEVYQRTIVEKNYIEPSRWALGVQLGYGVTLNGHPVLSPYIGLGISYNISLGRRKN